MQRETKTYWRSENGLVLLVVVVDMFEDDVSFVFWAPSIMVISMSMEGPPDPLPWGSAIGVSLEMYVVIIYASSINEPENESLIVLVSS